MTNKLVVIIVLKYQKLRKFYHTKWNFLYQITAASSYRPHIPVLTVLCPQLNLLNPPPEQNSWVRHWVNMRLYNVFGKSRDCSTCWNTCSSYCHLTLPSSGHIFSCWRRSIPINLMQGINFDFLYWDDVRVPGARFPWWPNFVLWLLISVCPQCDCFVSLFLRLEFWDEF